MGALIPFLGQDADLPPYRKALAALNREIAAAEIDLRTLQTGRDRLKGEIARVTDAKAELEARLNGEAQALVDQIKSGFEWALSRFAGLQTRTLAERLGGSSLEGEIAARAAMEIDEEILSVEDKLGGLRARHADAVKAVVAEAAGGILADYQVLGERLAEAMTQLASLEKYLGVQRVGRLVATLPDFARQNGLSEMPVVAPQREIEAALKVWERFGPAIAKDHAAPVSLLEFPPINPEDEDVVYADRSPIERKIIDSQFHPYAN